MAEDASHPTVGTDAVEIGGKIIEVLGLVLSTAFLSGINIAVSGHLLGYVLNLKSDGSDHFTLRIPYMFSVQVRGSYVIAGFAAYSLSLAFVGLVLSETARKVFITNLTATNSQWTACQGLAAILSVFVCLVCGAIRLIVDTLRAKTVDRTKNIGRTPEQRATDLVN